MRYGVGMCWQDGAECRDEEKTKPHRVQNVTVLGDPQQLVRHGYGVDVAVLAVVEVSIGSPNSFKHLDTKTKRFYRPQKTQTGIAPVLSEVAIHRVVLKI